jgi:hypothetical protein
MPHTLSLCPFPARCCAPFVAFAALFTASCSGADNTVHGQVLYQGNLVEGAVVTFHPKGGDDLKAERPSGLTDKEGKFTLSTGSKAGAPVGEYVVTVNWHKPVDAPGKKKVINTESPPPPPDVFQGKPYANAKTSKLTVTVNAGTNNLEPFRLD